MIYYIADPMELINNTPPAERKYYRLPSGGLLTAEVISPGEMRVVEISSTDPMDYMDARFTPGEVLKLKYE